MQHTITGGQGYTMLGEIRGVLLWVELRTHTISICIMCIYVKNLPRRRIRKLTMRLSDAGLRHHKPKLLYPDHRLPPWLPKARPRDRSNRLLDDFADTETKEHPCDRRCLRADTPEPREKWRLDQ